ncbi:MAG: RNA-protein complex protein Nop10 [Thermoprotei archaeon]|nr:MAG: RNA-protein complex protein Nop10 [Thermoprotei archaeon]
MRWLMRKCPHCNLYTLKDRCPRCGLKTVSAHPHRFSPEDRYVHYRVLMKYGKLLESL